MDGAGPATRAGIALLLLAVGMVSGFWPGHAGAVAQLVQTTNTTASGATSVSKGYTTAPVASDLLVIICGASGIVTISAPAGFSTAINESIAPSQGIFYKVATGTEGTGSFSCGGGSTSTRWGMQLYEYKGIDTSASPLDKTASATGLTSPASTGTTAATSTANELLIAGITSSTNTVVSAWTNSFNQENNTTIAGGTKMAFAGADRIVGATGTYTTGATVGSASWRGQIATFKESSVALTVDTVDGSGSSVASPSVTMSAISPKFICQTSTGSLGASTQKIRVNNTTANIPWTLSLAATSGNTTTWTAGTNHYKFNDPTGSGCTNGQLTVNPAAGVISAQSGCVTTGVSLGTSSAFSSGVADSITLASAVSTASVNCYWEITGISLSQKIPAQQATGSYNLGMTLTVVAN